MFTSHCKSLSLGWLCFFSIMVLGQQACAESYKGKTVKVADGDTITVLRDGRPQKIRLHGIDTPEKAQAFGQRAKKFTLALVGGKVVTVTVKATDRYGRTVGVVHLGARCLNEALLRAGLAWHYKQYSKSKRYAALEKEARRKKRGLWADKDPTPPWLWRRQNRSSGRRHGKAPRPAPRQPPAAAACNSKAVHGNLKSRVFHTCACRAFNCKNCRANFATAVQAEAAGYKGHEACAIGHPAMPHRPDRACKADGDCMLAPPPLCNCTCGKRWHQALNRESHKRVMKNRALLDGKCPCKRKCITRFKGSRAVCVKGQCSVR